MSEEMKMWIGLGTFALLPLTIMFMAWLTDRLADRSVTDRDRS